MKDYDIRPAPPPRLRPPRRPLVVPYRVPNDRTSPKDVSILPAIVGLIVASGLGTSAFLLAGEMSNGPSSVINGWLVGSVAVYVMLSLAPISLEEYFGATCFGRCVLTGTLLGLCAAVPCAGLGVLFGSL